MSIIDGILNLFRPRFTTREDKIRYIETKIAEAQLRLARERDKPDPDPLKIDRLEREFAHWDLVLKRVREQPKEARPQ